MKMKKILSLSLALLMAFSIAACGNGTKGSSNSNPGSAPNSSSGSPAVQPTDSAWPSDKTVQMIIPFGAGGDTDLHCRVLTDLVSKELGTDIVCTNVTGTSGTIAARQVMDSAADGYTILWHQTSFLMASLMGISEFDYTDFTTASTVIEDMSSFLCVNAKSDKFSNFGEFVQYAKDHPGELLVGISVGGDAHLYSLIMADKLGIELTYVDLDGTNEIVPALLNQDVDLTIGIYGTYKEYVDKGEFAALAYFGDEAPAGSDIPTWKSLSGESFPIGKMFGYWFPAGTPQDIVDKFNAAVEKVSTSDEWKEHCASYYITPVTRVGSDAVTYLDSQYQLMGGYKDALLGG